MDRAEQCAYLDYSRKCEREGSHHKLIYGSLIEKDKYIQETDLFKIYSLPIYGYPRKGDHFIGFEYGRINGLYDYLHYSYEGELKFTQCEVPNVIKQLFKDNYPDLVGSCHAIIQNVRNSHYASGNVMYGYWIITDDEDYLINAIGEDLGHDLTIESVGHNMQDTNSIPSNFFVGITTERFASNEDEDDHQHLAKQLSGSYSFKDCKLPSREDILIVLHKIHPNLNITSIPMICLIQNMCHCCT